MVNRLETQISATDKTKRAFASLIVAWIDLEKGCKVLA